MYSTTSIHETNLATTNKVTARNDRPTFLRSRLRTIENQKETESPYYRPLREVVANVERLLVTQNEQLSHLRKQLTGKAQPESHSDGWLDAKAAAKYMGISEATFDKYRYQTVPRVQGSKLDGKTLYKKSDLDSFVRLYEVKSKGLA